MAETKTNGAATGGGQPSKMDAVREALRRLGRDAKAAAIQKWVKDTYKLEMNVNHIYNCLSEIRKGAKKAGSAPAPAKKAAAAPVKSPEPRPAQPAASPAPARPVGGGGIGLEDIAAVKALLGRVGPEKLRGLIDLLAD